MKQNMKKIVCVVCACCLLITTGVFFSSAQKIDETNILWNFENDTAQGWIVDRPNDLNISVEQIAGSKALKIDHRFKDKTAQTWWDTAGIKLTTQMDLSQYDAITMDVIIDLSAISGYGYLAVEPAYIPQGWDGFYSSNQFYIYETPAGIDTGKLSRITVVCDVPEEVTRIEQIILWFVGGAIDYSGALYVDNIGFVKTSQEEPQEVAPMRLPYKTPVEKYGKLQVIGSQLCDQYGNPIQLRGMFTDTLGNEFINRASFQAMAYDWKCDVIRLGINVGSTSFQNYTGRQEQKEEIYKGIDLAIETGMYVIVDWHTLSPGNPNDPAYAGVDAFFDELSRKYAGSPNIIYEICNEPNGSITWANNIKPYAERLRDVIRSNAPDNIIIIGTGTWSQDVDIAALSPVSGSNLMYTFHFYCGTHTLAGFRSKVQAALDRGIAVFVTEWGVSDHTGAIGLHLDEANKWLEFLDENKISWTNFVVGASGATCASFVSFIPTGRVFGGVIEKVPCPLVPFTDSGDGYLYWPLSQISPSGQYVRNKLLEAYVEEPIVSEEKLSILKVTAGTDNTAVLGERVQLSVETDGKDENYLYSVYVLKDGKVRYMAPKMASAKATFKTSDLYFYRSGEYYVIVYVRDTSGQCVSNVTRFTVT